MSEIFFRKGKCAAWNHAYDLTQMTVLFRIWDVGKRKRKKKVFLIIKHQPSLPKPALCSISIIITFYLSNSPNDDHMLISLYKLVKKKVEDFGECRKTEKLKNYWENFPNACLLKSSSVAIFLYAIIELFFSSQNSFYDVFY